MEKTLDYCLHKKVNFALDGTFSGSKACHNVERALDKGFFIVLFYLYQDPLIAWQITQDREVITQRGIDKEGFISAYEHIPQNLQQCLDSSGDRIGFVQVTKDDLHDYKMHEGKPIFDYGDKKLYTTNELREALE